MGANNINVNLSIQASDLEVVLRVLQAFKKKQMLDFSVQNPSEKSQSLLMEGEALTQKELLKILEEAEAEPLVSHQGFKKIFDI